MTKKTMTRVLIPVMILLVLGAVYLYREFNRKAPDTADLTPAYALTGTQLLEAFQQDEKKANTLYLGKVLVVTGMIKSQSSDSAGVQTLVIGDTASLSSVRCIMNGDPGSVTGPFSTGTMVTIKGICTGYNADDMGLGADVLLNRSVPQNLLKP